MKNNKFKFTVLILSLVGFCFSLGGCTTFKKVGHNIGEAGKEVGHAGKKAGKEIGHAVRDN